MQWLKNLFAPKPPEPEEGETIESLTAEVQAMGREADELRERRREVNERLRALINQREGV